jgi:hypothetical protein
LTFSIETPEPIADNNFYIRNKTTSSFEVYTTLPLVRNIISKECPEMEFIRLSNNLLGVCYYDLEDDRVYFKHSLDVLGREWSDPILIDDVSSIGIISAAVVNGFPAVAYVYNEGVNDEWRYVRATDATGTVWGAPVTIYTSSTGAGFLPISVNLLVVNEKPVYLFNSEAGRARLYRANDINGDDWGSNVNISNLSDHQILAVRIVNNKVALVAKSNLVNNIYYVRSLDNNGITWPVASLQLFKSVNGAPQSILANTGYSSCDMGIVGGTLCIALSELNTNNIYLNVSNDADGNSWQHFNMISEISSTMAYPRFFTNNNNTYLIFNCNIGAPSKKCLIRFQSPTSFTIDNNFMSVLNYYGDHKFISNINDANNLVMVISENNISMLRFYDADLKINWIAHN